MIELELGHSYNGSVNIIWDESKPRLAYHTDSEYHIHDDSSSSYSSPIAQIKRDGSSLWIVNQNGDYNTTTGIEGNLGSEVSEFELLPKERIGFIGLDRNTLGIHDIESGRIISKSKFDLQLYNLKQDFGIVYFRNSDGVINRWDSRTDFTQKIEGLSSCFDIHQWDLVSYHDRKLTIYDHRMEDVYEQTQIPF